MSTSVTRVKRTASSPAEKRAEIFMNDLIELFDTKIFAEWCDNRGVTLKQKKKMADSLLQAEVMLIWPDGKQRH